MADRDDVDGIKIRRKSVTKLNASVGRGSTATVTYLALGTSDPVEAKNKLLLSTKYNVSTFEELGLRSISVDEGPNEEAWELSCEYDELIPEIGEYKINFDTSGTTVLQTSSFAQSRYAKAGFTAPDYKKAIDVQDGQINGVQRGVPGLKIDVTARIAQSFISSPIAYAKIVHDLTWKYNNATFLTFAAGELLLTGVTGSSEIENPTLVFHFLASPNVTGFSVGGITGITKKGHDFLWFAFKPSKDSTTNLPIYEPYAAYVDQIYEAGDFDLLKIGAAPA